MFSERIHLTNFADSVSAGAGYRPRQEVRSVAVDAYIGTSAGMLVIPESLRATLGLEAVSTRPVEIADGTILECAVTEPVTIRCLGETVTCQALVVPGEGAVKLGTFPLVAMALTVDEGGQRLVPAGPFSTGLAILVGQAGA